MHDANCAAYALPLDGQKQEKEAVDDRDGGQNDISASFDATIGTA